MQEESIGRKIIRGAIVVSPICTGMCTYIIAGMMSCWGKHPLTAKQTAIVYGIGFGMTVLLAIIILGYLSWSLTDGWQSIKSRIDYSIMPATKRRVKMDVLPLSRESSYSQTKTNNNS
jgi:hypothetical protein